METPSQFFPVCAYPPIWVHRGRRVPCPPRWPASAAWAMSCVPSAFVGSPPQTPFPWPGWLCQLNVGINEGGRWPQGALCSSGPPESSWNRSWHVPPRTLDAGGMCAQSRQGTCPNRLAIYTPRSSPGRRVLSWLRFSLEQSFLLCLLWELPLPSKRMAHFRLAIIKPILSFSLRNL